MIIEFRLENFRSYGEEQRISLVANNHLKELPESIIDQTLPGLAGLRYLKGAAIIGANASGKSNLILALQYLRKLILNSNDIKPGDQIEFSPFRINPDFLTRPTKLELSFVADGVRYLFGVSLNETRVLEEYLTAYPHGSPQNWYRRVYNATTGLDNYTTSSANFKVRRSLLDSTRPNVLFLSKAANENQTQAVKIFQWFKYGLQFLNLSGTETLSNNFTIEQLNLHTERERIIALMRFADFGISDVVSDPLEVDLTEMKEVFPDEFLAKMRSATGSTKLAIPKVGFKHDSHGGHPVMMNYEEESMGTRRFFSLIGPWLDLIKNGYAVFIDEMETSLHPLLVKELLKMLFSEKSNTNGAQVIFTSHNPVLINQGLLRRDQIWLTEKKADGSTRLFPLADFQPRKDEAIATGYLSGRYGAVPVFLEGFPF